MIAAELGVGSLSLMVGALAGHRRRRASPTPAAPRELPPPVLDVTAEPEHEHDTTRRHEPERER